MVITWAFLESPDPELGGCLRMTVDIVYISDWWCVRDKYYLSI